MEEEMAATESDIREMIERDRERQKTKPDRHTEAGTKMALDILNYYKFPGDPTSAMEGDGDGSNSKKPAEHNKRTRRTSKGEQTETDP